MNRATKLRHGYYTKIHDKTKIKAVSGEFMKGIRYGKWVFKDAHSGKVQLEYDYSNNSLVYIDNEQLADSFVVLTDDSYKYVKVDRPLVFIGYKQEETHIIQSELHIPSDIKSQGKRGQCTLAFLVNEKGEITSSKVITPMNSDFENQINNLANSFNGRFLPAIKDGKAVESVFYINVYIVHNLDVIPKRLLETPYINDIFLSYRMPNQISNILQYAAFPLPDRRRFR